MEDAFHTSLKATDLRIFFFCQVECICKKTMRLSCWGKLHLIDLPSAAQYRQIRPIYCKQWQSLSAPEIPDCRKEDMSALGLENAVTVHTRAILFVPFTFNFGAKYNFFVKIGTWISFVSYLIHSGRNLSADWFFFNSTTSGICYYLGPWLSGVGRKWNWFWNKTGKQNLYEICNLKKRTHSRSFIELRAVLELIAHFPLTFYSLIMLHFLYLTKTGLIKSSLNTLKTGLHSMLRDTEFANSEPC